MILKKRFRQQPITGQKKIGDLKLRKKLILQYFDLSYILYPVLIKGFFGLFVFKQELRTTTYYVDGNLWLTN